MQPEITDNQEKKGIKIRFTSKPDVQTRPEMHNIVFDTIGAKNSDMLPVTEARINIAK